MKKNIHHKDLSGLLAPRSVAVVGAARESEKIGAIVLHNIISGGFKGDIYPVNPAGGIIQNIPAYQNYAAIPVVPDMAVVAVPAIAVLAVLEDIGKKGTKNVIVLSAGFKEVGAGGKANEEKLIAIAEKYNLAIVGPNCLGILSAPARLNATFGAAALLTGNLRFISQSGAIATSFFDWAGKAGLGFSEFITLGNKAVVTENDVLADWIASPTRTAAAIKKEVAGGLSPYQPVGLYLESIAGGEDFLHMLKETSVKDPVFILKPGKSSGAQKAMLSHTGSIAGDDAVLSAALTEAGVIRCHGMEDLFDLAKAFAWERAPSGPSIAVVSNAGGPAVMSADLIAEAGLTIAALEPNTHTILQKNLPAAANINDPIDVLGDALADRYATAISAVLADKNVHALVVILTPQITTQIEKTAEIIAAASAKFKKPIVTAFIGGTQVAEGETVLNAHKIPCYRYPDRAIWVLGRMWAWELWRQNYAHSAAGKSIAANISAGAKKIIDAAVRHNLPALSPFDGSALLAESGLAVPPAAIVPTLSSAHTFLARHKKMVLKISATKLLHKTEEHGVFVGIDSTTKLHQMWPVVEKTLKKVRAGDPDAAIMAQKQIDGGVELIAGVKTDPNFGKILLFGAGGVMVELIADRNLHTLPINEAEINTLIAQSKINRVLSGYRGGKSYAVSAVVRAIKNLSALAQNSAIADIEINPLIVTDKECWAVDGKVILS